MQVPGAQEVIAGWFTPSNQVIVKCRDFKQLKQ